MSIFEGKGVSVRYGAVKALTDVDIALTPGRVHGVIGPNGAGKSTFIDGLSGRAKLTSGTVTFQGEDITKRNPRWRRRQGIARSFQRTSVFNSMTVQHQLEMVAKQTGEKDLSSIVDTLGLGPVMHRVCSEIAYGTQRSVDLALALVGDPKVILLDEPCAGLVEDESVRMLGHVKEIAREREVAALLVEHDVDGVFRTCDEVTVLNLGEVLASGDPAEVRAHPDVIRAYLGSAA
ncbi:ABC transporter ATP-binding protein [Janibacter sp. YIM B02568]|uniref:ABC transporter ATP-binding protein n=1 Tax=Janibacter endophyticus TaxID=2806261 RepID=UPI001950B0A3|nr:ATP-binding cassette domain-containing protein [Janibacter endophyticus]MBM6545437.1 ABC transporter ATP-binding protein [Janibacter endophyticus]